MVGMSYGRLIFPLTAVIARLDTKSISDASHYDNDFKEIVKVDGDGDGIGTTARAERTDIEIQAQVENDRFELQRIIASGDLPDTAVGLVVHTKTMEELGYLTAGAFTIGKSDRLKTIKDKRGVVVQDYSTVPIYCTEARWLNGFLGRSQNLALLLFGDRPQGVE